MNELEEIKKKFKVFKKKSNLKLLKQNFTKYGDVYAHTNENLKEYIPNLSSKKVLTVSASGDQILNIIGKGSLDIDTFDINAFSPLVQNLKLYAVRYLPCEDSIKFLDKFDKNIYFKFNNNLPNEEREIFNFMYKNYSLEDIAYYFFYPQFTDNFHNNNYFDKRVLKHIKLTLKYLNHKHYECQIYQLVNFLTSKYDCMFFSNISHYSKNPTMFLNYIAYLYEHYLNDNGSIYYGYIYNEKIDDEVFAIKRIGKLYETLISSTINKKILNNTELIHVDSADFPGQAKDTILVLRK